MVRSGEEVHVIDVGNYEALRGALRPAGFRTAAGQVAVAPLRITSVVITHLDADHCRGLIRLMTSLDFVIDSVFINPDLYTWKNSSEPGFVGCTNSCATICVSQCTLAQRIIRVIHSKATRAKPMTVRPLWQGDRLAVAELDGVVLWPDYLGEYLDVESLDLAVSRRVDRNRLSIAIKLSFRDSEVAVLVAGDCTLEAVEASVLAGADWSASVLVFPHHGGSLGAAGGATRVVELTSPQQVIFQNGRNQYDLPTQESVRAARDAGATVLCTQLRRECCSIERDDSSCAGRVVVDPAKGAVATRVEFSRFIRQIPTGIVRCLTDQPRA